MVGIPRWFNMNIITVVEVIVLSSLAPGNTHHYRQCWARCEALFVCAPSWHQLGTILLFSTFSFSFLIWILNNQFFKRIQTSVRLFKLLTWTLGYLPNLLYPFRSNNTWLSVRSVECYFNVQHYRFYYLLLKA